ncbi:sodium:calcium antiporter [Dehalobacter sp. DCM]|uniref:sodium:calcium antiporter n=1 Tax=Dehalobacter sp. DCM TaxID=2907827 RepID=UPI0030819ADA|nr:sodium:calcium antiporter [Dehalobacter sp. DCM]
MVDIILLIISLGIILLGAEVFTNGIEWLGRKLNLGEGAVGSIFAAVGTALPETLIPIIAILTATGAGGHEIGIGAILGAPFMLGTLAFCITGIAAFIFRRNNRPMYIHPEVIERDLKFFLAVYALAIVASFLPTHSLKMIVVIILLAAYAIYVYQTIKSSHGEANLEEEIPCCYFHKRGEPGLFIVLVQVVAALLIIVGGAELFIRSVQAVSAALGIPVFILAIIITPIATELPEKFNSVLWVRRGKDTLAMGNITGAMVFQSSVIPAIGISLTSWVLEPLALASAILALLSAGLQYVVIRRTKTLYPGILLLGGVFYTIFLFFAIKGITP